MSVIVDLAKKRRLRIEFFLVLRASFSLPILIDIILLFHRVNARGIRNAIRRLITLRLTVRAEIGEGHLIRPELVQETTEKISQIKDRLKAAHDHQKSYAGRMRKPLEFSIDGVHDTFHVSNLKKCLADPTLQVPLDKIRVDDKLNFVEEPVEIMERDFKKLKRSRIAIVKVRWNLKRGPEFTWEREDQMKLKYLHLFSVDK
ncbi:hypothetical protein Tco_0715971 [Tanacetum coccineum]